MSITHTKVSGIANPADPSLVGGADWDAVHTIAAGTITDVEVAAANKDGAAGTASMRTLGTGAAQAAAGNHTHAGVYSPVGHTHAEADVTGLVADLALKSPLASPTFTGVPSMPTAAPGTSTTQGATTAFVGAAISTAAGSYQPLDADLTALAASPVTAGLIERTGAAAYTTRLIGVANATDVPTRGDADTRYQAAGSYQPLDAALTSIAALGTAADKLLYTTGVDTFAEAALTAAGRALLDDADAAAQRTTLGLGTAAVVNTGTGAADVPTTAQADGRYTTAAAVAAGYQPLDGDLTALAALDATAGILRKTGADAYVRLTDTVAGRALLEAADAAAQRTALGLGALATLATVGTAQIDADAVTYAKIQNVSATDKLLGRSTAGAGDVEEIACTAAGRAILDDANAAAQLVTLGAQPLDADLTALAASPATAGLVERTGAATYATRAIGVAAATDIITRADGDARYSSLGLAVAMLIAPPLL